MQRATISTAPFKAAGVVAPRASRASVKVCASNRVDKFSKDDIIVSINSPDAKCVVSWWCYSMPHCHDG